MWFAPRTLSLITTHRCTAACEHCCFGCSPAVEASIPMSRLRSLVAETAEVPTIWQVVFTGGECFLLGKGLDDLIGRCSGLGLGTRCVSNGYWAGSKEAAAARVRELGAAGLKELNLSTGVFHARFVPRERVLWAAEAAAEAGLGVAVNIEAFAGAAFAGDALAEHPSLRPYLADGRVRVNRGAWIPDGSEGVGCGSKGLAHEEKDLRFRDGAGRSACACSLQVVSVTPAQDLISCCGLNLEYIPELHVGTVRDRSLRQALEEVRPDLLKLWIHVEGPERVLDFVKDKDPDFRLPLESAHICHTCQHLFTSPQALAVLARHREEVEARVLDRYLTAAAAQGLLARLA